MYSQAIIDPFSKKRRALVKASKDDSDDENDLLDLLNEFDLVSATRIKFLNLQIVTINRMRMRREKEKMMTAQLQAACWGMKTRRQVPLMVRKMMKTNACRILLPGLLMKGN